MRSISCLSLTLLSHFLRCAGACHGQVPIHVKKLVFKIRKAVFPRERGPRGGVVLDWMAWRCAMVFLSGYAGVLGDLCSIWWVTSLIELSIADAKFLESHPK